MPEPWDMTPEQLRAFTKQFAAEGELANRQDAGFFQRQLDEDEDDKS